MTTETKNKINNQTDNQATFAPLGKYAAIAVVMVGIIVTTAIMLDKQLNKAETEIASIEDEIAELNKVQAKTTEAARSAKQTQVATKKVVTQKATVATPIEVNTATSNQPFEEAAVATSEVTPSAVTAEANVDSFQARTDSYKVQQKVRMTEMFDRINQLESKQLEQFKTQQAEQVARLRNQVTTQQYQIDALIQRNENLFNLRLTSVQRNQAQREQMLNRI